MILSLCHVHTYYIEASWKFKYLNKYTIYITSVLQCQSFNLAHGLSAVNVSSIAAQKTVTETIVAIKAA